MKSVNTSPEITIKKSNTTKELKPKKQDDSPLNKNQKKLDFFFQSRKSEHIQGEIENSSAGKKKRNEPLDELEIIFEKSSKRMKK
jgi:hypothetical protein